METEQKKNEEQSAGAESVASAPVENAGVESANTGHSGTWVQRHWLRWVIIPAMVLSLSAGAIYVLYPAASQAAGIPAAGGWFGGWGDHEGRGERNGYLAEALGVSGDALDAAQDEAQVLRLQAMVENGDITQEAYDQLIAQRALAGYLGERMQGMIEEAVQQAVTDGVVTQAQADAFLNGEWKELRGLGHEFGGPRGGRGGHGLRGERGGFGPRGGDEVAPPATDSGESGS